MTSRFNGKNKVKKEMKMLLQNSTDNFIVNKNRCEAQNVSLIDKVSQN